MQIKPDRQESSDGGPIITATPHLPGPGSEDKVAGMFDNIAGRYDFLNRLLSAGQDLRWRRALLKRLPSCPAGVLLDVATGTGDIALEAAAKQAWWQSITGIDISKKMLELADQKLRKKGAAHPSARKVSFLKMSATELAFPETHFDAVSIAFGFRNIDAKEKALREFFRVLKPGGTLLILEFFLPERSFAARLFRFYFQKILPFIGALFSDKEAYSYLPESVEFFYPAPELGRKLLQAGFTEVRARSWLCGACRLFEASRPREGRQTRPDQQSHDQETRTI